MSTKTCSQTRAIQARRIFPFDVNMHNTLFGGNLTRIIDAVRRLRCPVIVVVLR